MKWKHEANKGFICIMYSDGVFDPCSMFCDDTQPVIVSEVTLGFRQTIVGLHQCL